MSQYTVTRVSFLAKFYSFTLIEFWRLMNELSESCNCLQKNQRHTRWQIDRHLPKTDIIDDSIDRCNLPIVHDGTGHKSKKCAYKSGEIEWYHACAWCPARFTCKVLTVLTDVSFWFYLNGLWWYHMPYYADNAGWENRQLPSARSAHFAMMTPFLNSYLHRTLWQTLILALSFKLVLPMYFYRFGAQSPNEASDCTVLVMRREEYSNEGGRLCKSQIWPIPGVLKRILWMTMHSNMKFLALCNDKRLE